MYIINIQEYRRKVLYLYNICTLKGVSTR